MRANYLLRSINLYYIYIPRTVGDQFSQYISSLSREESNLPPSVIFALMPLAAVHISYYLTVGELHYSIVATTIGELHYSLSL